MVITTNRRCTTQLLLVAPLLLLLLLPYSCCVVDAFVAMPPSAHRTTTTTATTVLEPPHHHHHCPSRLLVRKEDGSGGGDPWAHNRARTDVRNFLTQRAMQSFVFLLGNCRDQATVRWLEVSKRVHVDQTHSPQYTPSIRRPLIFATSKPITAQQPSISPRIPNGMTC